MKNIIKLTLIAGFTLLTVSSFSQSVEISPRNFTALDEITITVDVTGNSQLESLETAYLWFWVPGVKDANSNKSPASSFPDLTAPAKFTKIEENIFEITLVPASFLGLAPAEIKEVGVILKGNDWPNGQTQNFIFDVDPLEFVDEVNRIFPDNFSQEDIITVFFNAALAEDGPIQDVTDPYLYITAEGKDSEGNQVTDIMLKQEYGPRMEMKFEVARIYSASLLPSSYFNIPAGVKLTRIHYYFENEDGSVSSPMFSDVFIDNE